MSGDLERVTEALVSGQPIDSSALVGHQEGVCECTSIPVRHGWAEHQLIYIQRRHDEAVARLVNELALVRARPVNVIRLEHGLPLLPDQPAPEVVP